MLIDENDRQLHFLVNSIGNAQSRSLDLKIVLENLLGCQVHIHVYQEIKESFRESYFEQAIEIDESLEALNRFFNAMLTFSLKTIDDDDEIFGPYRSAYIEQNSKRWKSLSVWGLDMLR